MSSTATTVSNLSSSQKLYSKEIINEIGGNAFSAPHIGYLDENKSQLEVQGTITQDDSTNYFRFAYRKGDNISLSTNMNKGVRIQLLDSSGYHVLADSSTKASDKLKEAYANFTAGELDLKNTSYVIKVTFDKGVRKNQTLNYDFYISSGTTFKSRYKTKALATTIYNDFLEGGATGKYSAASVLSNFLATTQSDNPINMQGCNSNAYGIATSSLGTGYNLFSFLT